MAIPGSPINTEVENCISQVVHDFQKYPERFWNERDLHWCLFYYLKHANVCTEAYPTQFIRAEFPTRNVFKGKKPARGHYDLVILNEESYSKPEVQKMKAQAPWQPYLDLVVIDVAIEMKLWPSRFNRKDMLERIDWDVRKLTEEPHNIKNAYSLNFIQLDFKSEYNKKFYLQLKECLRNYKRKHAAVNILCVPSSTQIHPISKVYWL
jgi:hypothetical protein